MEEELWTATLIYWYLKYLNTSKWSILSYIIKINPFLTVDNLKASISEKTNMPAETFKIKWGRKYLSGDK